MAKVDVIIQMGTHINPDGSKSGVGDPARVDEAMVEHIPDKFMKINLDKVKAQKEEKETESIDIDEKIKELIEPDDELNEEGFPEKFEPPRELDDRFKNLESNVKFPVNYGASWYWLSNGCSIQGKDKATRGQKLLELIYGDKN